eukprot:maker-scaffold805_size94795-snap-gene-0.10 protein:Tk04419 transcript:maker-scaffold805_size94795-snap-gene-0.10-mRNA-1 annotation:"atp-dependent dna helicase"
MARIVTTVLLLSLGLPWAAANSECLYGSCWEQCIYKYQQAYPREVAQLFQMALGVRSGKLQSFTNSTVLLTDMTAHPNTFELQKSLMKIAAYALPVDKECNPTGIAGYAGWGTFTWYPDTGCTSLCEIISHIESLVPSAQIPWNPLAIACSTAQNIMNFDPFGCRYGSKRYAVAFQNSGSNPVFPDCYSFPTRYSVQIGSGSSFASAFYLRSYFNFDYNLLDISKGLAGCMKSQCCRRRYSPFELEQPIKGVIDALEGPNLGKRTLENLEKASEVSTDYEGTIYFAEHADPTNIKEVRGSLKEFLEKKNKEDMCKGREGEGCPKELCNESTYRELCPELCKEC